MPDFLVFIEPEAEANIGATYNWIAERSPAGAERWYRAFGRAIERLRADPERFPVAAESHRFDVVIRNLTFRMHSRRTYRILFTIAQDRVHILYVRGPGRDWLTP
ncbi:MAG: type II toxin-antitoxin system RelE/ParE family toxin [Singulisphaera sp.]